MKTLKTAAWICVGLMACGPEAPKTAELSVTVASGSSGKALQPSVETVPAAESFTAAAPTKTYTVDGTKLRDLWPLFAVVQAAPDTFADGLTVTASGTAVSAAQVVVSTSGSDTEGCKFTFEMLPPKPGATCGKDLAKGIKLIPAPTTLDVKVTVSNFESVAFGAPVVFGTTGASLASPSGAPRTLVWGSQGTIAKLAAPAKTTIASVASTVISGTINIATPPSSGSDLSGTVFLIVDLNADGLITADEVTSGTVALGDDIELSTVITSAAADKILSAAIAAELKYALVVAVRSKAGNINGTAAKNGIDVTASLSFKTTATTKAVAN